MHLRNVRGKVPFYRETFIDDGDVDILRVLRILKQNRFEGVIIPRPRAAIGLRGTVARWNGLCPRFPAGRAARLRRLIVLAITRFWGKLLPINVWI